MGCPKDTVVETPQLCMRRLVPEDVEVLLPVLGDPNTMVHYPRPFSREVVERWINRALDAYRDHDYGMWGVVLKESGELIGDCGILIQKVSGR